MEFNPQHTAVRLAIKRMMTSQNFSVTPINDAVKLLGIVPDPKVQQIMQTIHCVNFGEMDTEFRTWLANEVVRMFPEIYPSLEEGQKMLE